MTSWEIFWRFVALPALGGMLVGLLGLWAAWVLVRLARGELRRR